MILLIVISNEEAQTFKDHFSFGQKQIVWIAWAQLWIVWVPGQ